MYKTKQLFQLIRTETLRIKPIQTINMKKQIPLTVLFIIVHLFVNSQEIEHRFETVVYKKTDTVYIRLDEITSTEEEIEKIKQCITNLQDQLMDGEISS